MTADPKRHRAWRLGRWGETAARWRMRLAGYYILANRYQTPVGEIDLIARRGNTLVFIEVKARRDPSSEGPPVTHRQRQRIARAASLFLQRYPTHGDCEMRFDVISVHPWAWPRLIPDAWRVAD